MTTDNTSADKEALEAFCKDVTAGKVKLAIPFGNDGEFNAVKADKLAGQIRALLDTKPSAQDVMAMMARSLEYYSVPKHYEDYIDHHGDVVDSIQTEDKGLMARNALAAYREFMERK